METSEGRKLIRTMSFISSRAKALKQRFAPRRRSLSDSWQDQVTEEFLADTARLPSPDMGGSMLSLLDESKMIMDSYNGRRFRAQRSRSLDSLNAVSDGLHSPPVSLQFQKCEVRQRNLITPTAEIPRPHSRTMNIFEESDITFASKSESQTLYSSKYLGTPIPKIPGPPSPVKVSAATSSKNSEYLSMSTPLFPQPADHNRLISRNLSTNPLLAKSGIVSTDICNKSTRNEIIPKIPGPPPSPKHSTSNIHRNVDNLFDEPSQMFLLPVSPGFSQPTTPRECDQSLVDLTFPSTQDVSKHSQMSMHKYQSSPYLIIPTDSHTQNALGFPPLSPNTLQQECKRNIICGDLAIPEFSFVQHKSQEPQNRKVVNESAGKKKTSQNDTPVNITIAAQVQSQQKNVTYADTSKHVAISSLNGSETDSFDNDENRDTISDGFSRPTLFDLRPRPKLKYQWSMDESRTTSMGSSASRQMVETATAVAKSICIKPAEKRKRFFLRKQTNSAPDSFDGPNHVHVKTKESHPMSFCLGTVRKCRGSDSSIIPPVLPTIRK